MNRDQELIYKMHKLMCFAVDNGFLSDDLEEGFVDLLQESEDLLSNIDNDSIVLL